MFLHFVLIPSLHSLICLAFPGQWHCIKIDIPICDIACLAFSVSARPVSPSPCGCLRHYPIFPIYTVHPSMCITCTFVLFSDTCHHGNFSNSVPPPSVTHTATISHIFPVLTTNPSSLECYQLRLMSSLPGDPPSQPRYIIPDDNMRTYIDSTPCYKSADPGPPSI